MNNIPPRRSDGTIEKRREPLPWPKDRPFRILSIDGGGICGILPAAFLAQVERRFLDGRPITGYFDMIAGTSTGGIIALALGVGMSAAAIRDVYLERFDFSSPRLVSAPDSTASSLSSIWIRRQSLRGGIKPHF
jgi:predicted acylesterase/phospholipase RssA